ncbi:MAG: sigma-E factor negative regulatory protein RseC [Saprospiraceae bacterium]|jgi:sigma-E factor negative regulatory protein RseC|tara:strand:+ start:721 stop:1206 length:486 start_codon:yes stop_codon:yes gene_type:complete
MAIFTNLFRVKSMIHENATIVAIQESGLWVETIQQSTCQTCVAQKGCGQRLIAKVTGNTTTIRVLPGLFDTGLMQVHDKVVIGVPEKVIVNGTLLAYFLPLMTMVLTVALASHLSNSDLIIAAAAITSLCAGGLIVRLHSHLNQDNYEIHPILLKLIPTNA